MGTHPVFAFHPKALHIPTWIGTILGDLHKTGKGLARPDTALAFILATFSTDPATVEWQALVEVCGKNTHLGVADKDGLGPGIVLHHGLDLQGSVVKQVFESTGMVIVVVERSPVVVVVVVKASLRDGSGGAEMARGIGGMMTVEEHEWNREQWMSWVLQQQQQHE